MNNFLLFWNPHFSSYKLETFTHDFNFEGSVYGDFLDNLFDSDRMPADFNWSVIEHDRAHEGDRFFFIRVGYEKPTGLVGTGTFTSEPYPDEDWSGQGRSIFYMDMEFSTVVDPRSEAVLPTATLQESIPEIEWSKGKAGVMISPETAEKIQSIWEEHLEKAVFKGRYRE